MIITSFFAVALVFRRAAFARSAFAVGSARAFT